MFMLGDSPVQAFVLSLFMMDKQRLKTLFHKMVNQRLTDAETAEFLAYTKDPVAQAEMEKLALGLWEESADQMDRPLDGASEHRIQVVLNSIRPQRKIAWAKWVGWTAACLTLFVLLPFWKYSRIPKLHASLTTYYEVKTSYGQKKTLRMPDSSVVYLNAGSWIRYSSDFNQNNRSVVLKGEAYFEVAKNPSLPFTVESGGVLTKVLGTAFNVKAFAEEEEIFVALKTGSIEIGEPVTAKNPSRRPIRLKPGEKMRYNKRKSELSVEQISRIEAWGNWRNEVLSFNNMPFSEVKLLLERWYNVQVHVTNPALLGCHFTGSFENLPINKVLSLLSKSSLFKFKINGDKVYITGKGCP